MRIVKLSFVLLILFNLNSFAQEIVKLSEPDKIGGKPLMQALSERRSSRDFIDKELTDQQLSNLMWAAYGINRTELGKHTTPTSRNVQDMDIYITTKEAVYLYLPLEHALKKILDGDHRAMAGTQDFVKMVAVNLIYVSDFNRAGNRSDESKAITAAAHSGFIGQNVYLYCASEGLISVFRAMIDKEKIADILGLGENQHVIYCQSVGYSK